MYLYNKAQPKKAASGQATSPTKRSVTAMEKMIKFEGEDRSFRRGSIQTDKTIRKFPNVVIGNVIVARTATVVKIVSALSTLSQT